MMGVPALNSAHLAANCVPSHRLRTKSTIRAQAQPSGTFDAPTVPEISGSPNVVVLGGTGRVGASTAAALLRAAPNVKLTLASRNPASYDAAIALRPELRAAARATADVNNPSSLLAALRGADLIIHTAGPFQRRADCAVLEAAIAAGVPYLDVCDDTSYAQRAKALHSKAEAAGVPAITTAGIYPGVSNVMAAHMISLAGKEYDEGFNYIASPPADAPRPSRVLYSYYTAGSGGAGPTILNTTFLLAGEEVVAYKNNQAVTLPPVSNRRAVDFGPGIGRKGLFLYSLPEVASGREVFKVPAISARFGTDPDFWNWGMWLLARLVPKSVLEDPKAVEGLARLADPLVRAVDAVVGEKVAMLVEVDFSDEKAAAGLFVHPRLSDSVGISTAAFARAMLAGGTAPGVWYPEERGALNDRRALLAMATEGCNRFLLNKPPWEIESAPIQLGMGFYW
jgi:saccharopine dehydrogenase-like NADP-dependent oxidoreductase